MPLTVSAPQPAPPRIVRPQVVPSEHLPPSWRTVEAVAGRFASPVHRRAVRAYLYAVLRDPVAIERFASTVLVRAKLRRRIRRGRRVLEEARRLHPDAFADLAGMLRERRKGGKEPLVTATDTLVPAPPRRRR